MAANPLTEEQLQEAARLKRLFMEWQDAPTKNRGKRRPQSDALEDLGFNQSALSQYLSGKIPLNLPAALKFASLLSCSLQDFSPLMADKLAKFSAVAEQAADVSEKKSPPKWITPDAFALLDLYYSTDDAGREVIMRTARGLQRDNGATSAGSQS